VTDKIEEVLAISPHVRYVAIYQDGSLKSRQRSGVADPSASESDKYEELFVNPTLLKCATQRGELDCGGLRFIVIGYGHFLVLVMPIRGGHVTVGFEQDSNPLDFTSRVAALFDLTSRKRSAEPESANGTSRPNRRQQAMSVVGGEPGHLRTSRSHGRGTRPTPARRRPGRRCNPMGSATQHNEYIFVWPCSEATFSVIG
jgi:hypothetical protein